MESDFCIQSSKKIQPYDKFDNPIVYAFNKNGEMEEIELRKVDDSYIFIPETIEEFTPQRFYCEIDLLHQIKFTNDRKFNIQVRVDSYGVEENLSARLVGIFGDAYKRGKCPPNIMINGGSMLTDSMFQDIDSADFIFIESSDGLHYKNKASTITDPVAIDFETALQNKKNIWLVTDSLGNTMSIPDVKTISINDPIIFNKNKYEYEGTEVPWFYDSVEDEIFKGYEVKHLADSVIIWTKKNSGSIIISPKEMFDESNIGTLAPIIYEILMYAYIHSYKTLRSNTTWITDEPVMYSAFQNNILNANHGVINFDQLLLNSGIKFSDYYSVQAVKCSRENIIFTGITDSGNMKFQKVGERNEPIRNTGQISCLTTKGTVVLSARHEER